MFVVSVSEYLLPSEKSIVTMLLPPVETMARAWTIGTMLVAKVEAVAVVAVDAFPASAPTNAFAALLRFSGLVSLVLTLLAMSPGRLMISLSVMPVIWLASPQK